MYELNLLWRHASQSIYLVGWLDIKLNLLPSEGLLQSEGMDTDGLG